MLAWSWPYLLPAFCVAGILLFLAHRRARAADLLQIFGLLIPVFRDRGRNLAQGLGVSLTHDVVTLMFTGGLIAVDWILQARQSKRKKSVYVTVLVTMMTAPGSFPSWAPWNATGVLVISGTHLSGRNFRRRFPGDKVVVFSPDPALSYPGFVERGLLPGTRYLMMYPLAFFDQTGDPREQKFVEDVAEDLYKNKPRFLYFPVSRSHLPAGFNIFDYARRASGWVQSHQGPISSGLAKSIGSPAGTNGRALTVRELVH